MNLAHYLGSGIIMPSIYIENKNDGIQDRFKNCLLLSSSKFTKDTNCAIEIILNNNDEAPKRISEHFYLFDMPLPISRIKNIYFTNEEQKIRTAQNISYGDAFIPESLLRVSLEESIETKELDNIENKSSEKNWSEYLKKYDQVLGGFSIMKISKENFQNYPTHYFSTLGNINNLFSNILAQQNVDIDNNFQFAFTNEERFKNFHNTIYSDIDYNEVQRYAEKDKVKLEVKYGAIQIDKIPENTQTYLVAILESYGEGKRKQVDSFISDLIAGKFIKEKKEGLSLIFGMNKGYKAFRNKYKTSNFEVDIKFHLDSKLDYYIIESIYQNVFNSLNSISSFAYIDSVFPETKKEAPLNSKFVTYQMLDETIIWKEREITAIDKLLSIISETISGWFPSFFTIKKNEIEFLFKKEIEDFKSEVEKKIIVKHSEIATQKENKIKELENALSVKEKNIMAFNSQLKEYDDQRAEAERQIEELKTKENDYLLDIEAFKKILEEKEQKLTNEDDNKINSNTQNTASAEVEYSKVEDESVSVGEMNEPYKTQDSRTADNTNSETLFPLGELDNSINRKNELGAMTVKELKNIAKKYNIEKISSLSKSELISAIIKHEDR